MIQRLIFAVLGIVLCAFQTAALAQDLTVGTVTRAPFSLENDGMHTGFSIDLMNAIAAELDRDVAYTRFDSFGAMISAVQAGEVDAVIANVSITAEREAILDFSQPIFDSGIQVMLPGSSGQGPSVLSAIFTREFVFWAGAALALLFGGGMLMWVLERGRESWFDRPAREALFPSFWWALNLMLNGGFEERMPNSRLGRAFAIVLVIASLFFVSIFVAQITATLTVEAITEKVDNLNDLDGRRVGTIGTSTTASFLDLRGIAHTAYGDLDSLLSGFETGQLDAVVFDGPILAYYAAQSNGAARVLDKVYRPENYGIAYPTGSVLREPMNQALLKLRETGVYNQILTTWFGPTYSPL